MLGLRLHLKDLKKNEQHRIVDKNLFITITTIRLSTLFTKTSKTPPKGTDSVNARLLIQGGYINQEMAGVYSYLPLGLRVLNKIEDIVRDEMNMVDGQEVLMPSLSSKEVWLKTGRWDTVDVLFKLPAANENEFALNPTHEEVVTPIGAKHVQSYKDFPYAIYQIQTKFRNEPRAKSGLLRGREFRMKDLYSFHTSEEDRRKYYNEVRAAYTRIFDRLGLGDKTFYTYASGGAFTTEYSGEFQTVNEWGEDTVHFCACGIGYNEEIFTDGMDCMECGSSEYSTKTASEVGNIFPLGTRFSEAFGYMFTGEDGKEHPVIMGCYGLGTSRVMGVIAEVLSDEHGLVWPASVAPYLVNVIPVGKDKSVMAAAEALYGELAEAGVEVLLDDRDGSPGGKFADHDLLGIPYRIVISAKTIEQHTVELKKRSDVELKMVSKDELFELVA